MFYWNSLAFLWSNNVGHSGSSAFSRCSLNICKFMVHIPLKPGLENFEHYFTGMWDECNCAVVWACFGLPIFGVGMKMTFSSPVDTAQFSKYAGTLSAAFSAASSFRIWNSSTGIPSPPLAYFVVMLPKAHLSLHSRMSGFRWVLVAWVMNIFFG